MNDTHLTGGPRGNDNSSQLGFVCPESWDHIRAFLVSEGETFDDAVLRLIEHYCSKSEGAFSEHDEFLREYMARGSATAAAKAVNLPTSTGKRWAQGFNLWVCKHGMDAAKRKTQRDQDRAKAKAERLYWVKGADTARIACQEACGRKWGKHKKSVKAVRGSKRPNSRYYYYKPASSGRCPDCPMRAYGAE